MRKRAPRACRLSRRADISRVFDSGRRVCDERITLLAAASGLPRCRLCVAVTKRHGTAVVRNRLKRVCREAFRLIRHELPGGLDYVILPREGDALTLAGVQESLRALAPRIADDDGQEGQ